MGHTGLAAIADAKLDQRGDDELLEHAHDVLDDNQCVRVGSAIDIIREAQDKIGSDIRAHMTELTGANWDSEHDTSKALEQALLILEGFPYQEYELKMKGATS